MAANTSVVLVLVAVAMAMTALSSKPSSAFQRRPVWTGFAIGCVVGPFVSLWLVGRAGGDGFLVLTVWALIIILFVLLAMLVRLLLSKNGDAHS
ncbi:MAG: hypothetical protein AAF578_04685 [Pseudomonadota bacterium]